MLDERRRGIINQATYELEIQENQPSNAVQKLEQQLQQQYMEISSRNYDYDKIRGSQLLLSHMRQEVGDLGSARVAAAAAAVPRLNSETFEGFHPWRHSATLRYHDK